MTKLILNAGKYTELDHVHYMLPNTERELRLLEEDLEAINLKYEKADQEYQKWNRLLKVSPRRQAILAKIRKAVKRKNIIGGNRKTVLINVGQCRNKLAKLKHRLAVLEDTGTQHDKSNAQVTGRDLRRE